MGWWLLSARYIKIAFANHQGKCYNNLKEGAVKRSPSEINYLHSKPPQFETLGRFIFLSLQSRAVSIAKLD